MLVLENLTKDFEVVCFTGKNSIDVVHSKQVRERLPRKKGTDRKRERKKDRSTKPQEVMSRLVKNYKRKTGYLDDVFTRGVYDCSVQKLELDRCHQSKDPNDEIDRQW
ncbi:hypothetical protein RUM44_003029 [Polyplax serrata]|uniref:FCP1 homology domain-containing protein n=1 Tax=Polyplax serrata TaxID=468196 RepID=A0ABR1AXS9_POLSC